MAQTMGPSDPLLVHLWESIKHDKANQGGVATGASDEEMRSRFLAEIELENTFCVKGPKCFVSRWFSWCVSQSCWDSQWHTRLLGLSKIVVESQWAVCFEDLFDPMPDLDILQATTEKQAVEGRGKQTKRAQETPAQLRERTVNSLHCVAKLMADSNLLAEVRIIACCARPLFSSYNSLCNRLSAPSSVRAEYSGWAAGSWMGTLSEVLAQLRNTAELEHIGFDVDAKLGGTDAAKQLRMHQDTLAVTMGELATHFVRERAGSMLWHSDYYPGKLALLLDPKTVDLGMFELKKDVEAWRRAAAQDSAALMKLVRQSCFNDVLMHWVVRFAEAERWLRPSRQLLELVESLFSGFNQSRVNEEANQRLRDSELRDNSSREVKFMRMWEIVKESGLLRDYCRDEVQVKTQGRRRRSHSRSCSCRPRSTTLATTTSRRPRRSRRVYATSGRAN